MDESKLREMKKEVAAAGDSLIPIKKLTSRAERTGPRYKHNNPDIITAIKDM